MNPIFIEYYAHTSCDCYKINLPWSKYKSHTMVLCVVDEGEKRAKSIAKREIKKHLESVLKEQIERKES